MQPTATDDSTLDPVDAAWQRRQRAIGPLAFGVIALVLSPLLVGLVVGPLGLRSAVEQLRRGQRGGALYLGLAANLCAIVVSVVAALLWGSLLATILLGRDAMRETERWRGQTLDAVEVSTIGSSGRSARTLRPAAADSDRIVLVFVRSDSEISREYIRAIARLSSPDDHAEILIMDPVLGAIAAGKLAADCGVEYASLDPVHPLPTPLDSIALFPSIVAIDRDGRIENAVAGARTDAEIVRILKGPRAMADPARPE